MLTQPRLAEQTSFRPFRVRKRSIRPSSPSHNRGYSGIGNEKLRDRICVKKNFDSAIQRTMSDIIAGRRRSCYQAFAPSRTTSTEYEVPPKSPQKYYRSAWRSDGPSIKSGPRSAYTSTASMVIPGAKPNPQRLAWSTPRPFSLRFKPHPLPYRIPPI